MTNSGMSAAIKAQIISEMGVPADMTQLQKFCDALAAGIVSYIQANAQVPATGTVTSGPGSGGSVTTAGTVT
jgi:hypothetical protein